MFAKIKLRHQFKKALQNDDKDAALGLLKNMPETHGQFIFKHSPSLKQIIDQNRLDILDWLTKQELFSPNYSIRRNSRSYLPLLSYAAVENKLEAFEILLPLPKTNLNQHSVKIIGGGTLPPRPVFDKTPFEIIENLNDTRFCEAFQKEALKKRCGPPTIIEFEAAKPRIRKFGI